MRTLRSVGVSSSVLLLMLTSVSGCGAPYGGAKCRSITLDTQASSLPLRSSPVPVEESLFRGSEPFIAGTAELACCVQNPLFTPARRADCSQVDCTSLRQRLTVSALGNGFIDEPCGRRSSPLGPEEGVGRCQVLFDGDRVAGVWASCLD